MNNATQQVREALIIEEEGQRVILGFTSRIRCRTLLTEQYRLTIYDGADWGELYDLNTDPYEMTNLWDLPKMYTVRAELLQQLAYLMLRNVDTSPYPTALA